VTSEQIFTKYIRNPSVNASLPQIDYFLDEPNSLGLRRVYVLGTKSSASASELLINSLRGVDIEVILIGETTNGKNMGMDLCETVIGQYKYEMWPITFKTLHAQDFCNYAGGFSPDIYKNEFWDITNASGSGVIHPFGKDGDYKERLLATALALIDGHSVSPDIRSSSRSENDRMEILPQPVDPHRGGMKYIPPRRD
jgi:hypothetical protein